jgi:hypothetical protein
LPSPSMGARRLKESPATTSSSWIVTCPKWTAWKRHAVCGRPDAARVGAGLFFEFEKDPFLCGVGWNPIYKICGSVICPNY